MASSGAGSALQQGWDEDLADRSILCLLRVCYTATRTFALIQSALFDDKAWHLESQASCTLIKRPPKKMPSGKNLTILHAQVVKFSPENAPLMHSKYPFKLLGLDTVIPAGRG